MTPLVDLFVSPNSYEYLTQFSVHIFGNSSEKLADSRHVVEWTMIADVMLVSFLSEQHICVAASLTKYFALSPTPCEQLGQWFTED